MDNVKIFICCTVHPLCSDYSTSKGLEFKSSGRRFTYIHIQIKFYFVKKKKKFIRWSMCVKQPMVNWRFLNEKKKKEKGINWQIQKWQPISKDINEWKTQRWENVEFLFARQSSSPTHIFIYDFVVVCIYWLYVPLFIMLFH